MNALKHGLRAAAVLLPGDDAEEFHEMRQEMFDLHKPRTRNEARCVEAMADHEWSMARCRRIRSHYQGKLIALLEGTDTGHCEKDPHRWHHSAMDCSLDERRIGKLMDWELNRLELLQKLRRQNLIQAAEREETVQPKDVAMPARDTGGPGQAALSSAELLSTSGKLPAHARPAGPERRKNGNATASGDGENWKNFERTGKVEPRGRFDEIPLPSPAHGMNQPPILIGSNTSRARYTGVSSM
jgi:hypothetical protein